MTDERLYGLDWLRIAAFGLLILYHIGMFFVPWDWHIKTASPIEWLEAPMLALNAWRLPLLFLISGSASAFLLAKSDGALAFARSRLTRLLLPLLAGVTLWVAPQPWVELTVKHGYAPGFGHFWLSDYFRFAELHGIVLPTWNHLWFVAYLLAYSLLLAGVAALLPTAARSRLLQAAERATAGPALLLLPFGLLFLLRWLLLPRFPETHAFVDDGFVHAESLLMFALGLLVATSAATRAGMVRLRSTALGMAFAGYGLVLVYWAGADIPYPLLAAARAAQCWGAVVALAGFALSALNRDHPARRALTEAVFPFYIAHQTIIVLAAWALHPLGLTAGAEFTVLVGATVAGCWLFYKAGQRSGPLRPLFGLGPQPLRRLQRAGATA